MALSPFVIFMPNPETQIWDKDLNVPLAAGVVTFYEDKNHGVKKSVYQLVGDGIGGYSYVELPNPLILSGIGTFVDTSGNNLQVYMYPYVGTPFDAEPSEVVDLYYITVASSTNVEQFTVNAWPPGIIPTSVNPQNEAATTGNIILNSQFVDVVFSTASTSGNPFFYTTTGTNFVTQIAPDWYVITTGSGTFSVYQQPISDSTAPGNPAYALGITSASYSSPLILRQRIYAPRIFSGGYVSGTFLAESTNGSAVTLTMSYIPSGTGTPQVICTGTTLTTGFTLIANATPVSITTGASGSAPSAYVDIAITIPVGAAIQITNIQLCGVSNNVETVAYLQNTPAEEINGLFHYFQPQLNFKPIPSMLVGWDFPMNPFQFINNNITTTPGYIGDQTIAASSTGTVAFSSDAVAGSAVFRTGTNSQAWYILQYLQGDQAFDAVTTILSSDIQAYVAGSGSCKVNVYMYYSNGGGVIPALPSTIGTINNSGVFSLTASGWSQILPITPDLAISLPSVSAVGANTQFIGYNAAQFYASSSTANFAMVVTFTAPTTSTTINVLSVSLNKGYIPTVPAPLTADEVLRQCQYYYETSDPDANGIYFPINSFYNGSTSTVSCATPFELNYQQKKRVSPAITITSLAGTAANVTNILNYQNATGVYTTTSPTDTPLSSFWANPVVGTTRLYYLPNTKNLIATATSQNSSTSYCNSANIYFNYILDSRLGVV